MGALAYVLVLAIVALGVPLALSLRARVNAEVRTQAQAQADLVAATAADLLAPARHRALQKIVATAADSIRGRVLVVGRAGQVLADSAGPAQLGSSYENRPELEAALAGRQIQVQRWSQTLGQQILATATPIIHDRRTVGAVRVTQSVDAVHTAIVHTELWLALIGAIVLGLGLAAGAVIAQHVARPLRRLEQLARRISSGDLTARAPLAGSREQRSLARSFNEMTDRLVRILQSQKRFVADASHQLRTPLTGLRLRLEEAQAIAQDSDAVAEIDAAISEVDRLTHTVAELLELSRAGERLGAGERVDLDALAHSAVDRWRAIATRAEIEIEHRTDHAAGTAWASYADIERSLDVLVENALNYSPRGTTVTIATAPGRIEVRDRGPGIDVAEQEEVFERFRRGGAGRTGPAGDGLGLAISRELARAWAGDVVLSDRPGGGLIAALSLGAPLTEPDLASAAR